MKHIQLAIPGIGIFCLAVLIRMLYNLTVARGYVPQYDSAAYEKIALHLLQQHCFCLDDHISTAGRAPLWPTVIAVIYALTGQQNSHVRYFLCFLGAGTCLFIYLLARQLFTSGIALVAGIIAACYPGLFLYDSWLYSESLYTFLLTFLLFTLYKGQQTKKVSWMVYSGILLGLLSLTRPNGLIVLALIFIWAIILVWKGLSWKVAARNCTIIALLALVCVLPWTVRNYVVSDHHLIPVATGDGIVMIGAYNYEILDNTPYRGQWIKPSSLKPEVAPHFPDCGAPCEVQRDAAYNSHGREWIWHNLDKMPTLLTLHLIKMWTPLTPEADLPMNQFPTRLSSQLVHRMALFFSLPIFLLAAWGLIIARRKWKEMLFIYLLLILTVGQCLYFYGSSRFRAPIEPLLVLLAAACLGWCYARITSMYNNRQLYH